MDKEPEKSYYAIIPANVRYDDNLTPNAKLLYGEITALCNEKGFCWAKNDYFSKLYKVSKTSISKWISQLVNGGYITNELIYKEGTKEIEHRYLRLIQGGNEQKLNTPIEDKLIDNNTVINNTVNNTKNKKTNSHKYETCDMENAMLLYQLILENDENAKKPNLEKWANDIRMTRTIDNRTTEQIAYMIKWTQENSFWKSNILSPAKLRKQFSSLVIKMKSEKEQNFKQQQKNISPWRKDAYGETGSSAINDDDRKCLPERVQGGERISLSNILRSTSEL